MSDYSRTSDSPETSEVCRLSAQSRAFSTILTGFVGSIVTGISEGPEGALIIGFVCWFAALRIILVSGRGVIKTLLGPGLKGKRQPFLAISPNDAPGPGHYGEFGSWDIGRINNTTCLGSMGWIYNFIWTPIIQILWVKANWSPAPAVLLVARAVSVSVVALSYTIDTRARYGKALGKKLGSEKVVPRLMNVYSALMNMLLSIVVVVLLSRALVVSWKTKHLGSMPAWILSVILAGVYVVCTIIWWYFSFSLCSTMDARLAHFNVINAFKRIFLGLIVGVFSGLLVSAPSIWMWQDAKWLQKNGFFRNEYYTGGLGLRSWLSCTLDSWWRKAVQILP